MQTLFWLPLLRELSAASRLRESFLHRTIYRLTGSVKIAIHIQIANPQHLKLHSLQLLRPNLVLSDRFRRIMTTAVEFDYEPCFRAIKIYDIATNRLLSLKSNRIIPKKFVPELALPRGHVFSQLSGKGNIVSIIIFQSFSPFGAASRASSLIRGRLKNLLVSTITERLLKHNDYAIHAEIFFDCKQTNITCWYQFTFSIRKKGSRIIAGASVAYLGINTPFS